MIMAASEALAATNPPDKLSEGRVYPGLSDIRSISARCVLVFWSLSLKQAAERLFWKSILSHAQITPKRRFLP